MNTPYAKLDEVIMARGARRGLHGDGSRIRYANRSLLSGLKGKKPARALYVGVGHGFNALVSMEAGWVESAVGVDPYIARDGNDDEDYRSLLELIDEIGLKNRFSVERMPISDFLASSEESFDLIVCNDVLHHIFQTSDLLTRSAEFERAIGLFESLLSSCESGGSLIIAEPGRNGLRQWCTGICLLKSAVNYRTKQPWREWDAAAAGGGWSRYGMQNYVPYDLRGQSRILSGALGRALICDKYILYYEKK